MRSQPRVLIAMSLLAAIVPGNLESHDQNGPFPTSHRSTLDIRQVRPICDTDNGGLTLPSGFCAVVVYDAKTATGAPARLRHIAVAPNGDVFVANQSSPGGGCWRCGTRTGMERPTRRRNSAPAPGTGSTSRARISISHQTIASSGTKCRRRA